MNFQLFIYYSPLKKLISNPVKLNTKVYLGPSLKHLLGSRHILLTLNKRKRLNSFFRMLTLSAALIPLIFLGYMILSLVFSASSALQQTKILFAIEGLNDVQLTREVVVKHFYHELSLLEKDLSIEDIKFVVSSSAIHEFIEAVKKGKKTIWVTAASTFDWAYKHSDDSYKSKSILNKLHKVLKQHNKIQLFFNKNIFIKSDSSDPTQAGMRGAIVGSLLVILISTLIALPVGVMTAFCLEEIAPKNKLTSFIEVSINNLSATPAIIFGILGLSIYVNLLGIPRGSVLAGGLTLSLMMLPILVITTRLAIKSVPITIKQAALALGASKMQVILHHVLPLSTARIVSGTLLGISRVLGESAPLLMIGMVAFIADIPSNILEPATVFPVQIYIWAKNPDPGFAELNAVLIIILLILVLGLNLLTTFINKLATVKLSA